MFNQGTLVFGLAVVAFMASSVCSAGRVNDDTRQTLNARYRSAVDDARAGQAEESIKALRALVELNPERQDILGDYAVVLGWAGDHAAALNLLERMRLERAPSYVIESLANSARQLQRYDLSESLYRGAQTRFPTRIEPQIGLVRTLVAAGKFDDAKKIINRLRARFPSHPEVLIVYADVASARNDYFGALSAYQVILIQDSTHPAALRGKIQTLARLGAPQLAIELADRNPGALSSAEREAIAADGTAHQIRWGTISADIGRGSERFTIIDHTLEDSEVASERALNPAIALNETERQLALDRISALHVRYRMRDAVVLYEALAARPTPMPGYAKSAAASAYLYLEQPEISRDLYREALVADPDNLESNIGLFYALAECEAHDAALRQIELTVAMTPQWIDAWSPETTRDNPAYARVLSARAMAPLFANRPGEAEQRLHELADRVPYNMAVRTDYASSMRARGWPRTAEQELRWILAADPDNSSALGERSGALLEMRDYRNSETALALAQSVAAEDGRVVRAARLWEVHNLRELIVDATYGRSGGAGPTGTRDYEVDTHLYSSPLFYNYRAFAHAYNAQAKFDNGTGKRNRVGAGLEYRSPMWTLTGELAQDDNEKNTSAAASAAFSPDDFWTLRGVYEKSTNQIPLQASLVGIDARRLTAEVVWRPNESRSAAASFENLNFTDGNRRDAAQVRWTERMIAGPVYKLEVTGALYASRNSQGNTAYFNPSRDFSPTLEFANEWLQWRRYTRAFRHRLVASVGNYHQEGFSTGSVYDARYEQEWEADDQLTFRYGIGRSMHPYDGVRTTRNYGYFYLNGKF